MNILQIGSNKGYDDLTDIVKQYNPEKIEKLILVEPQPEFNQILSECYHGYNFVIENVLINTDENVSTSKFYSCEHKEISSIKHSHLQKHNQYNFVESLVPSITLNNLLKKHKINILELLFIDAEGFDDEIIKSIDFEKFDIKKIIYENLHINNNDIIDFLTKKNFIINKNVLMNGWSNEAVKKS